MLGASISLRLGNPTMPDAEAVHATKRKPTSINDAVHLTTAQHTHSTSLVLHYYSFYVQRTREPINHASSSPVTTKLNTCTLNFGTTPCMHAPHIIDS